MTPATVGVALFVGVVLLYWSTFASTPTADGNWYLHHIERSDYRWILNASSALTGYVFFALTRVVKSLGLQVGALAVIQTVNALVGGAGVVLFYAVARLLGSGAALGALAGGLLAVSFGYWYYTNGEYQHVSLVILLVIFYLLVRMRTRGAIWGWRTVAGLALLNSVAVLFRQENFLFGLAALTLLVVGRPRRAALRDVLVYTVVGSAGTLVLIVLVGRFLAGVTTLHDYLGWYLWLRDSLSGPQEFQGFEYYQPFDVPRVIKGQLTAFTFGTQAVVDVIRKPNLVGMPRVDALVALTVVAYGLMTWLALDLWRARRSIRAGYPAVAAACAVWLVAYAVLVHAWFWPTYTKYHVVTLPPLVLLLMLGPIASRSDNRATWRVTGLLVVVFVSTLWGAVVPWHRYGEMREALAARQATQFRPDDLFISAESGIDVIFLRGGTHVELKTVFRSLPPDQAFASIRRSIDDQLARRGRVYIYNFTPSPYTLIAINQALAPARLGPGDFEAFFDGLRRAYVLRPLFTYWEEGKAPLYLFGEQRETFWELTARP